MKLLLLVENSADDIFNQKEVEAVPEVLYVDPIDDAHGAFCAVLRSSGPGKLAQTAFGGLVEKTYRLSHSTPDSQANAFQILSVAARSGWLLATQQSDSGAAKIFRDQEEQAMEVEFSLRS